MQRFSFLTLSLAIGIFFNSNADVDRNYIVNSLIKESNLTYRDIERGGFSYKSIGSGVVSVVSAYNWLISKKCYKNWKNEPIQFNIAQVVKNRLWEVGLLVSGYGAYKLYTKQILPEQSLEKIKKYVLLCDSLSVARQKYSSFDALKDGFVTFHNTLWIGKNAVTVYNGMQNLVDQGCYALELLDLIKDQLENKAEIAELYKKINDYLFVLDKNQQLIHDAYIKTKKEEDIYYRNLFIKTRLAKTVGTFAFRAIKFGKLILGTNEAPVTIF